MLGTVLINRQANERPKGKSKIAPLWCLPYAIVSLIYYYYYIHRELNFPSSHQPEYLEWELKLRPICNKLRIVEKLGGAHLMITGSVSVAVRVYSVDDANRLEERDLSDDENADGGVDRLRLFRDKFEHSLVIFILPTGQHQRDQLGRRDSFVSMAQKSLLFRDDNKSSSKHVTRTAIVTDTTQVIQTIESVVQSLQPEKREMRKKYFESIANKRFLPGGGRKVPQEVVANQVRKTFNEWGHRFELAEGDSAVALNTLESLVNVATANASTLDDVPIRDASKNTILTFFGNNATGTDNPTETKKEGQELMEPKESNDEELYDDLDDTELLDCPDPSTMQKPTQALATNAQTPFHPRTLFQPSTIKQKMGVNMAEPVDFTPMIPPQHQHQHQHQQQQQIQQQYVGRNNLAEPSIFPDSFSAQGGFSQHQGFQQSVTFSSNHDNGNYQDHMPNVANNNYQSYHHGGNDNMEGGDYQGANQGYGGGYSYSQNYPHPHTQFM